MMEKATMKTKSVLKKSDGINVTRNDIADFVIGLLGFFMGRVVIFGDVNPLGIAYMSAFFLEGKSFYIAAFFTLIGVMTKFSIAESLPYIICIMTMSVLNIIFAKNRKKGMNSYLRQSAIASIIFTFSGLVVAFANGGYLYFILMAILKGVLTFSVAIIIKRGISIISGRTKHRDLSNEDLISLAIIAGGIIVGSADIYIGNVSLRYYFCSILIMIMSYKGGLTMGATAGMLLGFLLKIAGYEESNFVVVLSVAGLIAGSVKDIAKQVVAAGYALGAILIALYLQRNIVDTEFLFSVLFSGITFILLPEKIMFNISAKINPALDSTESYLDKLKELTTHKLEGFARAFERLSKVFSGASEKRTSLTQKDVSNLIDDVAAITCLNCEKKDLCWEENFFNTYQTVFSMLNACEKTGKIETDDVPEEFIEQCINVAEFSATLNRTFELYKTNLIWHNRMVESRELVSQQLFGVSKVVGDLAKELDLEVTFKEDLEKALLHEFNKEKIEVESVIVLENSLGKYEVNIKHNPCYNKSFCSKKILPIINKTLGKNMRREDNICFITRENNNTVCKLNFVEEQKYCLTSAISRVTKDGGKESGDSYSYMELKNGQCLLALSDGMGTGKKANEESSATIDLLEEFIETGFDKDTAIKMINSALLLKSSEESFSTLDICSVDLYTGETEFMKIGASSTFLVRKNEVAVIRSWSLPVGILNDIDLDITQKQLKHGDVIVMVTDGILDVENEDDDKEGWIRQLLSEMNAKNPQDIADIIIEKAKEKSGSELSDDMTVLAARFWEKSQGKK